MEGRRGEPQNGLHRLQVSLNWFGKVRDGYVLAREGVFNEHTEMDLHEGPARTWQRLLRVSAARWRMGLEQRGSGRRRGRVPTRRHAVRSEAYPRDARHDAPGG